MPLYGVDVGYDAEGFDWNAYKEAGHLFRLFKATEGATWPEQDDPSKVPLFKTTRDSANVVYNGLYHFARPDNNPDPWEEAKHFIRFVGDLCPGEGIMLDWEPPKRGLVLDPAASQDWVVGWLEGVESAWPAVVGN